MVDVCKNLKENSLSYASGTRTVRERVDARRVWAGELGQNRFPIAYPRESEYAIGRRDLPSAGRPPGAYAREGC